MKRFILILLYICLVSILLAEEDPIALTEKAKGTILLERAANMDKIGAGKLLIYKDQIISKEDSYAAIKYIDGSGLIKLYPDSKLIIKAEKKDGKLNKHNYLQIGSLFSKVKKKMGMYEVETPTTVASVKGTEFLIKVDEVGNTELYTLSGTVSFINKKDQKEVDVHASEKAFSNGEGEIQITSFDVEEISEELEETSEDDNKLQIEMQNNNGDKKTIEIEFE